MIGQVVSHYRIDEKLGEGGMGVVYRALDERLQRPVALKFLPPHRVADERAKARFLLEAQAASSLDHPNVCVIYEIGELEDGELFIAMAYYGGETLSARLTRGPLPLSESLDIACQLASGLGKAHERGIVHRDVKPSNLILTEDGLLKILDFGIAKLGEGSGLTRTEPLGGTMAYMSPESAAGEGVTAQADLWSAGVVLYEMVTARLPFRARHPVALLNAILNEDPAPLRESWPEAPDALQRVVSRALEKGVGRRYATMGELLADLRGLRPDAPVPAVPPLAPADRGATLPPFLTPSAAPTGETELPPFVGRDAELAMLDAWLKEALAGRGRVGFVTGDAGSGKTALVREFGGRVSAAHHALAMATGHGHAHTGVGDPYHPFREILGQLTGDVEAEWTAGSVTAAHATRLWSLLPIAAAAIADGGADLLGTFLSEEGLLARGEAHPSLGPSWAGSMKRMLERRKSSAALRQADLFEQYVRVLRALARERPLVLVVDDLQWADTGTIGLFFHLGRQLAGSRILLLGLYRTTEVALGRDGERHPLEPVVNELTEIFGDVRVEFGPTGDRGFVGALIDAEPNRIGEAFREALFEQTRGHALFTVELLRRLKERRSLEQDEDGAWVETEEPIDWTKLPARVDAVLGERIGRLSPELQRLLTVASVEGERFTLEAVADAVGVDPKALISPVSLELERRHGLVETEGLRRVEGQRLSVYRFRHILFQRHLYDRLSEIERADLHERVGRALEGLHGDRAEEIALTLAHHFGEAGLPDETARYLALAAQRAMDALSYAEAIPHFRAALAALLTLPPSEDRDRRELELQLGLGYALHFLWVPDQLEVFSRAHELAERLGAKRDKFWALIALALVSHWAGDQRQAWDLAKQFLSLAVDEGDPALLGPAHETLGRVAMWRGEFRETLAHYEAVLASRYDPKAHTDRRYMGGLEVCSVARGMIGWTLAVLGYPDQAVEHCREGVAFARRIENAMSLAFATSFESYVHYYRGDVAATSQALDSWRQAVVDSGTEPLFRGVRLGVAGWCEVRAGHNTEGVQTLEAALADVVAKGQGLVYTFCVCLLADALRNAGRAEEGLKLLDESPATGTTLDERIRASVMLRVRGELLLALDEPRVAEAEALFHEAIEIARGQEAKWYELRASLRLARLLRDTGRADEAHAELAEIYGWFTEGHDLPDLLEARELLAELEAPS